MQRPRCTRNLIRDGTNPRISERSSARKGGDQSASQVGCDEEVDELGMIGYSDVDKRFLNIFVGDDSDDDDEEMKRDFLLRSGDKIYHETILGV